MSIVKRNRHALRPFSSLFDDFFKSDLMDWGTFNFSKTETTIPAVNIKETDAQYEVEVAAPGMEKDDFKIEIDDHALTISSEKRSESEEKDGDHYSRREFSYQSFQRRIQLPQDLVDVEKIQAKYENGLLLVTVPKKEEAKRAASRRIEIQ